MEGYVHFACANISGAFSAADNRKLTTGEVFDEIIKYGVILQTTSPADKPENHHEKHLKESDYQKENIIIDEKTGVIWDWSKSAAKSEEEAKSKGYRDVKDAYKGYIGQMIDGVAYKGFKPDVLNKSGLFEIKSPFLADNKVWDVLSKGVTARGKTVVPPLQLRPDEKWMEDKIRSGMPAYLPVPEHRSMKQGQLILTSYKANVQTQSRTQNCKWLTEIYHNNPALMNPATAAALGLRDGDMINVRSDDTDAAITTKLQITQGIVPGVIAISYHMGHWAYGRYASGNPIDEVCQAAGADFSGHKDDRDAIWWRKGAPSQDPRKWHDARGVHPNWLIPNKAAPVSGQWRSNDTVVTVSKA